MTSLRVIVFRKFIKTVFLPLNRCCNYCNKKIMQIRLLLFFLRRVDLPHPLFITWEYDITGETQILLNFRGSSPGPPPMSGGFHTPLILSPRSRLAPSASSAPPPPPRPVNNLSGSSPGKLPVTRLNRYVNITAEE